MWFVSRFLQNSFSNSHNQLNVKLFRQIQDCHLLKTTIIFSVLDNAKVVFGVANVDLLKNHYYLAAIY